MIASRFLAKKGLSTLIRGLFDPSKYRTFRFTERSLSPDGAVRLGYALDDEHEFVEEFDAARRGGADLAAVGAAPRPAALGRGRQLLQDRGAARGRVETGPLPAAAAALLEALYSEGLGEFAVVNPLRALPRPAFAARPAGGPAPRAPQPPTRVLVPIGGGKDSIVALEIVRRSGLDFTLFSVRDHAADARDGGGRGPARGSSRAGGSTRAARRAQPSGALNGHVPITAIVVAASRC